MPDTQSRVRTPWFASTTSPPSRKAHAVLDQPSRIKKALKIERILSDFRDLTGARVLEIGTGSGFIAQHFAQRIGPTGQVDAIDVLDQRQVSEGFNFRLVKGTTLPFEERSYDVIISNHVIEHVGDRHAQLNHLVEIKRVLKAEGLVYLAVPNRWSLIEPHYKLACLSWLPAPLPDLYLRASRRGTHYDCEPLSHAALTRLLQQAGFDYQQMTFRAMRFMREIEGPSGLMSLALGAPQPFLYLLYPVVPTLIMLLAAQQNPAAKSLGPPIQGAAVSPLVGRPPPKRW